MKFNIGDKVVSKKSLNAHTDFPVLIVDAYINDAVVVIAWGQGYDGG